MPEVKYFPQIHAGDLQVIGKLNVGNGVAGAAFAPIVTAEATFTETTGAGVYTASISIPAGATILDVQVQSTALWTAATSATMKVGNAGTDNGWYTGINLKATDLLVGEVIRFGSTGGKEGAFLVTATGLLSASYSATAQLVTGIVTTVGASGSAGRTRMTVTYSLPPTPLVAAKV